MVERVRRWRWPLVVVLFGLCVLLKLNGSSVAFWTKILHEPETQSGLLPFSPKLVRLDEWHAWTPSVLSQARQKSPFPIENPSLGAGRSPLLMSVPVAYYTTFSRPQFWGFSFSTSSVVTRSIGAARSSDCCSLLAGFLWQLGLRNRGLILFGTLWILFSGYIQWWLSSLAMLPEMLIRGQVGGGAQRQC
jgi:hypothetical protein